MPRYYFHVRNGQVRDDREGVDLEDDQEAWHQATLACGEMLRDLAGSLPADVEWRMSGTDAEGRTLFEIHVQAERLRTTARTKEG